MRRHLQPPVILSFTSLPICEFCILDTVSAFLESTMGRVVFGVWCAGMDASGLKPTRCIVFVFSILGIRVSPLVVFLGAYAACLYEGALWGSGGSCGPIRFMYCVLLADDLSGCALYNPSPAKS